MYQIVLEDKTPVRICLGVTGESGPAVDDSGTDPAVYASEEEAGQILEAFARQAGSRYNMRVVPVEH